MKMPESEPCKKIAEGWGGKEDLLNSMVKGLRRGREKIIPTYALPIKGGAQKQTWPVCGLLVIKRKGEVEE